MNREIKYRAWFKKQKQMSNPFRLELMTDVIQGLILQNDVEIMQYAGLKDKNGKEIYEGDIIGYVREENDRDWLRGHDGVKNKLAARSGVVEFKDGKFVLHWHYGNTHGGLGEPTKIRWTDEYNDLIDELDGKKNPIVEIIGDIYQNPELLTTNPPTGE